MFGKKPDQRVQELEKELEKLRHVLNSMGEMAKVGFWELDLATKRIFWTDEVYKIHGVSKDFKPKLEDGIGFYAPESVPVIRACVEKAIKSGEPFDEELLMIPKGGKERIWVRSTGKAIYIDGNMVRLAGTFQDITLRKNAENEAKERERILQAVIDGIPDIVGIQKPDHTIVTYNKAGLEFLKIGKSDLKGKKCYQFVGRISPCDICATGKALESKLPHTIEKYVNELGIWLECRSSPVLDENGDVELIIEILRDITERKKTEAELLKKMDELERFQKVAVGREKRIIELKGELRDLKEKK